MFYAWESIMVNEFADLEYLCSTADLAPSGPSFKNIANQACAVPGAIMGQATVLGADHIREQYGMDASHLWRNVGINIAIFIAFAIFTGIGMELHKPAAGTAVTVLYRKDIPGCKPGESLSDSDVEKYGQSSRRTAGSVGYAGDVLEKLETHNGRTLMWNNLSLDIEVGGKEKRLLNDLNGM